MFSIEVTMISIDLGRGNLRFVVVHVRSDNSAITDPKIVQGVLYPSTPNCSLHVGPRQGHWVT